MVDAGMTRPCHWQLTGLQPGPRGSESTLPVDRPPGLQDPFAQETEAGEGWIMSNACFALVEIIIFFFLVPFIWQVTVTAFQTLNWSFLLVKTTCSHKYIYIYIHIYIYIYTQTYCILKCYWLYFVKDFIWMFMRDIGLSFCSLQCLHLV